MAVVERIFGNSVSLYVDDILVGCAKSIEISLEATELDTSCQGQGNLSQAKPGRIKATWSIEMLDRQATAGDSATNITGDNIFTKITNGTAVTILYGTNTAGDIVHEGSGYIKSFKQSGSLDGIGSISCSGWFNSITQTTNT